MTRTDIHRFSQINPADYEGVLSFARPTGYADAGYNWYEVLASLKNEPVEQTIYGGDGRALIRIGSRTVKPLPKIAGKFFSQAPCTCDICGARFTFGDVWQHKATGEVITVGHDCADKFGLLLDRRDLDAYRDAVKAKRLAERRLVSRRDSLRVFAKAHPDLLQAFRCRHHIVRDIRARLIRDAHQHIDAVASLSDKQVELVHRIAKQEAEKATRPVEKLVAAPVTGKRQVVEGVVVSVKTHDGAYGESTKMTVKVETADGVWLAWGTAPVALLEAGAFGAWGEGQIGLKGKKVRFEAVLKAGKEPHFALFSRPTKPKMLSQPVSS